jgi:hypothetical protein
MPLFSGSKVWLCNICWARMYRLSPHLWTLYKPISYRVRREKAQCYSTLCQKYHIFWEKRKGKTSLLPWWGSINTTNERLERIIQRKLRVLFWKPSKTRNNDWSKTWDIVLDLIVLLFNYSRHKWRLRSSMVESNMSKFES